MLTIIHKFLEKRPVLTLIIFLIACMGTCLIPLAGVFLYNQADSVREEGVIMALTSLFTLICLGIFYVVIVRSPLHPGPSPHEALAAQGFVRKARSEQLPTYLRTISDRQVTVYCPANNTGLTLEIACSPGSFMTIWAGAVPAIAVPINWLLGRRRLNSDAIPDNVTCMAKDIEWGKSLLGNPQVRSILLRLLVDSNPAATCSITMNRKSISFALNGFQEGATITPDKVQNWTDDLCVLAELVEKQADSQ
ncbi:MAG: hypothetical protein JXB30_03780 [Anaerolineae bacterium]|nr:hypothetical protein [Anaerolineae bacterium]